MKKKMRVMTEKPLNAETPIESLRTWTTDNTVFFKRNQGQAWRHWEYLWDAQKQGDVTIMSRATDTKGRRQPEHADWNVLGYGNNGIREHAVQIDVV